MNQKDRLHTHHGLWLCMIVLLTISIYWPVYHYEFIHYDDPLFVSENLYVKKGFTIETFQWAFQDVSEYWIPLTRLSHMLAVEFFGLDPGAHHIINVLLHLINSIFLYFVSFKICRNTVKSAFIAGFFALHPVHIESVAWVSERKNVLSTLFFLITLWIYLQYAKAPNKRNYILFNITFLFGLMSKPILVVLPFVLMLLDFWPLTRYGNFLLGPIKKPMSFFEALIQLTKEKIPLFAFSIIFCFTTYYVQKTIGAVKLMDSVPLTLRISNVFISYVNYLGKIICPTDLAVFYPYYASHPWWQVGCAVFIFFSITCYAIYYFQKKPWFIMGWGWYLITLVPVIGIIQSGGQSMADRYLYIPAIGIGIILAWTIFEFNISKKFKEIIVILILTAYTLISWSQIQYWQNTQTLFEHAASVTDHNYVAYKSLGSYYYDQGRLKDAFINFKKALQIRKKDAEVYNNMGVVLIRMGKYENAVSNLIKAIDLKPNYAPAHNNLGAAYELMGQRDMALDHYEKALDIDPNYNEAKKNLERLKNALKGN